MLDFQNDLRDITDLETACFTPRHQSDLIDCSIPKLIFDWVGITILFVPLILFGLVIIILNPFLNPGPVLFIQERMGHNCSVFSAIKFRTMLPSCGKARGAFDEVEQDRITRLGQFMRRTRIDELPQIINVLRGEMSLIGPRPDSYEHAKVYLQEIPDYRARHRILPGISGLAQIEVGYVDGLEGVKRKVAADLSYIAQASLRFDLWIAWRTLHVILARQGQ